ncbi:hypothetical protein F5146DRAFT_1057280 [Armillaria mellea]|nr:hypothetical protein F5146DRAFT_1057280 [Armillaria mellea]
MMWRRILARLLSKQEDFTNQISMLETVIKEGGHEFMFLPKFHCELNPIEMANIGAGVNIGIVKFQRGPLPSQRLLCFNTLMLAH